MQCRTCEHSKKSGQNMVYCVLFGIYISPRYNRCDHHKGDNEKVREIAS